MTKVKPSLRMCDRGQIVTQRLPRFLGCLVLALFLLPASAGTGSSTWDESEAECISLVRLSWEPDCRLHTQGVLTIDCAEEGPEGACTARLNASATATARQAGVLEVDMMLNVFCPDDRDMCPNPSGWVLPGGACVEYDGQQANVCEPFCAEVGAGMSATCEASASWTMHVPLDRCGWVLLNSRADQNAIMARTWGQVFYKLCRDETGSLVVTTHW